MRDITEIIIHCSATPEGRDFHAADIDRWHRAQGWNGIGYHYVVTLDGVIEFGRDIATPGAHCIGHNSNSIAICYIGGCDAEGHAKDTRTPAQRVTLSLLLVALRLKWPNAQVHGHREFAAKACPSFDVSEYQPLA